MQSSYLLLPFISKMNINKYDTITIDRKSKYLLFLGRNEEERCM